MTAPTEHSRRPGLRLAAGQVTVLLGPDRLRQRVLRLLDDGTARCPAGHREQVARVAYDEPAATPDDRLRVLADATAQRPALVLVDRLTGGLDARDRRTVLSGLRQLAAEGAAVLVDDHDPVAALAVADQAVRVLPDGTLAVADLVPTSA